MKNSPILILILAAQVAFFSTGCEEPPTERDFDGAAAQHIVGGEETGLRSWKGVVALVTKINGQSAGICSGALIAPDIVLTAGHCVKLTPSLLSPVSYDHTKEPQNLLIKTGDVVGVAGGKGVLLSKAKKVIHHPTWTGEINEVVAAGGADLALVQLESPVSEIGHYCIREGDLPAKGDSGIIVGYGLLGSNRQFSGGVHRWGETTILEVNVPTFEIGDPTATCQGDSGGPLFTQVDGNWQVTGVTSYGGMTCLKKRGAYSANVVTFADWINETVEEWTGNSLGNCTLTDADFEEDVEPEDPVEDNDKDNPPVDPTDKEDKESTDDTGNDGSEIDNTVSEVGDDITVGQNADPGEEEDLPGTSSGGCRVSPMAHRVNSLLSLVVSMLWG